MTIADTIHGTIEDNWGNGGYGGDTPEFDNTETQTLSDAISTDVIEVRHYTLREDPRPVNDSYTDRFYTIDVYVSSKTSNAQLKLLYDEVEYLLRNTTMTGIQLVNIIKDWSVSFWEQGKHSVILHLKVLAPLSSGTVTTAAGTSTNIIADTLVFEDGGSTVDIIRDEDDMTSDDANALATQQSIKAYVDGKTDALADIGDVTVTGAYLEDLLMYGSANAAWVPCPLEGGNAAAYWEMGTNSAVYNTGANNPTFVYGCPLPTNKGGLKLYISGTRIQLVDADDAAYVNTTRLRAVQNDGTIDSLDNDGTDKYPEGLHEDTFTAVDCSGYEAIKVQCECVVDAVGELEIGMVSVRAYYAA